MKILIADDNSDELEITKRALSKIRHDLRLETTMSGEATLEKLSNQEDLPSLILLDKKMHGMSGIETLRKIRADRRLKHIPVIMLSALAREADKEEALSLGANSFILKAFDLDEFSRDLETHLEYFLDQRPETRDQRPETRDQNKKKPPSRIIRLRGSLGRRTRLAAA